jgi:hypothetical protein
VSFAAIRWALDQPVDKASAKFVLVAMASCVNSEGGAMVCWPSVQHLADMTSQDRKTVIDGMRRLREAGFIEDTKERRGATGQVVVYLLKSPAIGTVTKTPAPVVDAPPTTPNSTENGTGTENGTVPLLDGNSTAFPYEESRFSLETVPKTGHGIKKESVKNKERTKKKKGFDASLIDLPEWLESEDWAMWCRDRSTRGKGISEDAARLQIKSLDKYRAAGFTPREVIEHTIASSYTGLYPPKRAAAPSTGKHSGFAEKNYREGVDADGSFN